MKTAVCLVVKNEEASIAEWIAYHRAIGFDTIIVFDNASTDRTVEVVNSYARHHDVRRINWANATPDYQNQAYDFAIANFRFEFDWICFIDCDEFIVPLQHDQINHFLEGVANVSAVGVNWAMFGSSGHKTRPEGLVIENFRLRSDTDFSPNKHVKSLVRPMNVIRCYNPHYFEIRGDYVSPSGRILTWERPGMILEEPDFDVLRVNHYFVKSSEQWTQKIRRGYHDLDRPLSEFDAYDRNEVPDTSILRFVPRTREIMLEVTN